MVCRAILGDEATTKRRDDKRKTAEVSVSSLSIQNQDEDKGSTIWAKNRRGIVMCVRDRG